MSRSRRHRHAFAVLAIIALVMAGAAATRLRFATTDHGPMAEPLYSPWWALTDNLQANRSGWFGLVFRDPIAHDIVITGLWGLGVSDNLELGPAMRGRGTADPVIWPDIDADRLTVAPLAGDNVFAAGSSSLDNALIVGFHVVEPGGGELQGFRIDYRYRGRSYRLFLDTYHCVAGADHYTRGCPSTIPDPMGWRNVAKLEATPIPFAQP